MNFLDSIKWSIFLQRQYRVAFFSIDKKTSSLIAKKNKILCVTLTTAVVLGELFLVMYSTVSKGLIGKSKFKLHQVMQLIELASLTFCTVNMITNFALKQNRHLDFFKKILNLNETLQNDWKLKIDYRSFKIISLMSLILRMMYYNGFMFGILLISPNAHNPTKVVKFLALLVYVMQRTCKAIFYHGYVECVFMIHQRAEAVSNDLRNFLIKEKNKVR